MTQEVTVIITRDMLPGSRCRFNLDRRLAVGPVRPITLRPGQILDPNNLLEQPAKRIANLLLQGEMASRFEGIVFGECFFELIPANPGMKQLRKCVELLVAAIGTTYGVIVEYIIDFDFMTQEEKIALKSALPPKLVTVVTQPRK